MITTLRNKLYYHNNTDQYKKYRGCNIVLDNARVHRTQEVAEALISMDLKPIFLPPYSPQLNPIELLFARLKGIYKSKMVIKL